MSTRYGMKPSSLLIVFLNGLMILPPPVEWSRMICGLATEGEFGAANDGFPAGVPLPLPAAVGPTPDVASNGLFRPFSVIASSPYRTVRVALGDIPTAARCTAPESGCLRHLRGSRGSELACRVRYTRRRSK